jgi:hypothetical protein
MDVGLDGGLRRRKGKKVGFGWTADESKRREARGLPDTLMIHKR